MASDKLDFCCSRFKDLHQLPRNYGLNIRVICYGPSIPALSWKMAFFLVEAYEIGKENIQRTIIEYCPFCGVKLKDRYTTTDYANEEENNLLVF